MYAQQYRRYRKLLDVVPHPVDSVACKKKAIDIHNSIENGVSFTSSYVSENEIPPPPPLPTTPRENNYGKEYFGSSSPRVINTKARNFNLSANETDKKKDETFVEFFNDSMRSLQDKLNKTTENKSKSISNDKGISLFTLDVDLGGGRGGFIECFHDGDDKAAVAEFYEKQAMKATEQDIRKLSKLIREKRKTYKAARSNLLWIRPNIGELKLTLDNGQIKTIPIREMDAPHYLVRQFLSENPGSLVPEQIVEIEELIASFIRRKQKQKDNHITVDEKTGFKFDELNDIRHDGKVNHLGHGHHTESYSYGVQ